jgi:DNA gyrase subunit A
MTIHFRANQEQLRPLGRPTRGVKAMALREGDELISMDVLPSQVADMVASVEAEVESEAEDLDLAAPSNQGPWALVITMGGLGKRVPVSQFRLQNRAGMGLRAIKFRKAADQLAALMIVNDEDEIMMVSSRGIIIRQAVNAISCQSRAATGVRVQRLDEDDAIAAVAIVPPSQEGEEDHEAIE